MSENDPRVVLDPELDLYPDTSLLVTEDGKPVDNLFVEKQYRLLTEPLWTSWTAPEGKPFRVLANVGLFFKSKDPPLVPDVMFALDVESPKAARESDNRSYFVWIVGKPPDIAIEIVSDKRGREDSEKLRAYERIKVPFYVIFDPEEILDGGVLRAFGLYREKYQPIEPSRFGDLGAWPDFMGRRIRRRRRHLAPLGGFGREHHSDREGTGGSRKSTGRSREGAGRNC